MLFDARDQTQGLGHAGQMLYHSAPFPSLNCRREPASLPFVCDSNEMLMPILLIKAHFGSARDAFCFCLLPGGPVFGHVGISVSCT